MIGKLRKDSMYFDTQNGATKKIFKLTLPHEVVYTMKWDAVEVGTLKKYEESDKISDKLLMLAMIAKKVENE